MSRVIDITVPLRNGMPSWPGSAGFSHCWTSRLEQDGVNVSRITSDLHAGTHIDAPLHFVAGGGAVDDVSLDLLCGRAEVVEIAGDGPVSAGALEAAGVGAGVSRLLLKTRNSALWREEGFRSDYAGLTAEAARWVVQSGIRLIGVDYLSVQLFGDPPEVHRLLLEAGVVVLEGLDLSQAQPGSYELICLPLLIPGAEGAPARAILRELR